MRIRNFYGPLLAGAAAGIVAGLFGAGGGMVLVPLLCLLTDLKDHEVFDLSISVILPVCLVSLTVTALSGTFPWTSSLPYLIGSAAGGYCAAQFGRLIPTRWLHRGLGILILWGGIRYLC